MKTHLDIFKQIKYNLSVIINLKIKIMENIEKVNTNFGGQSMEINEAEARVKAFNEKAFTLLKTIKEKDPTAHFNQDRVSGTEQAIVFAKNGRIIIDNNLNFIVIRQDGKEKIQFSSSEEGQALAKIQEIIDSL